MKENYRWYMHKSQGDIHRRKESWFTNEAREKIYNENYIRVNGENDKTVYKEIKPIAKKKTKKAKKSTKK